MTENRSTMNMSVVEQFEVKKSDNFYVLVHIWLYLSEVCRQKCVIYSKCVPAFQKLMLRYKKNTQKPGESFHIWVHILHWVPFHATAFVYNCTCTESWACVWTGCCGSASSVETEPSPRVRVVARLATKVRWGRGHDEVDPQDSPTTSAGVSASSDSWLLELTGWRKLPQPPLTTGCLTLWMAASLPRSPPTTTTTTLIHFLLRQTELQHHLLQTVINSERDPYALKARASPQPCSPLMCAMMEEEASTSACISSSVILKAADV